jgi:uncharacterized protein YqeY
MTIIQRLIDDKADAFKLGNRELKDLLGTVIAEAGRDVRVKDQKNPTDDEMIMVLKKFIENLRICNDEHFATILETNYMPQELSMDELSVSIQDYCITNNLTEKKQMGLVMKFLKDNFNGRYDGKLASIIILNMLK